MKLLRLLAVLCCASALGATTGKKISDYTETLIVGDAWIYEIAVPGVTNYKVTFGTMATNIIARVGSTTNTIINSSGNLSFNTTNDTLQLIDTNGAYTGYVKLNGQSLIQFSNSTRLGFGVAGNTNWYINNDGAGDLGHWRPTLSNTYSLGSVTQSVKRLVVNDVSLLGVTMARPLFLDASGNITNVSGTPNGLQFVRDDGSLAVPGGGGDVTTAQLNNSSNALAGAKIGNLAGLGTNLVLRSGATSVPLTIDTNVFVVTGGNVGIGTASAFAKFVLVGNAYLLDPTAVQGISITSAAGNPNYIHSDFTSGSDYPLILGSYHGLLDQLVLATNKNVGIGTNLPGYKLEVNGTVRITGAVMLNNGSPAAGQVPTYRSDGTIYPSNVVATASGTNFPPVTTTGTNIIVGTGVRKSLLMPTNASVGISFNGTEILGETLTLVVTNTSATASNITIRFFQDGSASTYFDATVASNVAGFLVVSNSSRKMEFVYSGSSWRLESSLNKEMELTVSGGLTLATNSTQDTVTLSTLPATNSFIPLLVSGTGGGSTNFTFASTNAEAIVNGSANVNITAITGGNAGRVEYVNLTITNGSGSGTAFSFPETNNLIRWASVYGTNAPVSLTNNTALMIGLRIHGTNIRAGYVYFPWP